MAPPYVTLPPGVMCPWSDIDAFTVITIPVSGSAACYEYHCRRTEDCQGFTVSETGVCTIFTGLKPEAGLCPITSTSGFMINSFDYSLQLVDQVTRTKLSQELVMAATVQECSILCDAHSSCDSFLVDMVTHECSLLASTNVGGVPSSISVSGPDQMLYSSFEPHKMTVVDSSDEIIFDVGPITDDAFLLNPVSNEKLCLSLCDKWNNEGCRGARFTISSNHCELFSSNTYTIGNGPTSSGVAAWVSYEDQEEYATGDDREILILDRTNFTTLMLPTGPSSTRRDLVHSSRLSSGFSYLSSDTMAIPYPIQTYVSNNKINIGTDLCFSTCIQDYTYKAVTSETSKAVPAYTHEVAAGCEQSCSCPLGTSRLTGETGCFVEGCCCFDVNCGFETYCRAADCLPTLICCFTLRHSD